MLADPPVLISEDSLQLVPLSQQALGVARQAKIDDVRSIAGIQLRAVAGRKQIVNAAFIRRLILATPAMQSITGVASQWAMTIRTSKLSLKFGLIESYLRCFPALPAYRGQRSSK
jgi:hypothetical protein